MVLDFKFCSLIALPDYLLQNLVANFMAKIIIYVFKMIDIHHEK